MNETTLKFLYFSTGNIKLAGDSCHHDHFLSYSMAYIVSAEKTEITIIFGKAPRLLSLQITKMLA